MHDHLLKDIVVEVPAAEVWEFLRGLELKHIVNEHLKDVFGTVEVVEGDGSVGTILKITFPPGAPGAGYFKEIFTKIDDEKRLKVADQIEGVYKDLGFDLCRSGFQIFEKDAESCTIRVAVEYVIDDKLAHHASSLTTKPMEILAEAAGKYLKEKRSCPTKNTN